MYVSWKKRQKTQEYALSAHLVKAVRIDGKPRQHIIAHLCTLQNDTMQQLDPLLWLQSACSIHLRRMNYFRRRVK